MFKPGTRIQAWCDYCEQMVAATFAYGQAPVGGGHIVDDVLRATCDQCGRVVALAPEASPAIAEALKKPATGRSRTTVRISKELREVVGAKLVEIGASAKDFDLVINAFVTHFSCDARDKRALLDHLMHLEVPTLGQVADSTITLRLKPKAWQVLEDVEDTADLHTSELIRRILYLFIAEPATKPRAKSAREETPLVREARRLSLVS